MNKGKSIATGFIVTGLTLLLVTGVMAHGHSEDNVPGHECEQGIHLYNPHCNPTVTVTPTPTEEVTPTPTEQVSPTATPTPEVNTGGGGSDGHTESLGCQHPSDNCNVVNKSGVPLMPPSNSGK